MLEEQSQEAGQSMIQEKHYSFKDIQSSSLVAIKLSNTHTHIKQW